MEILRWQMGNALKNYQYIIADSKKNAVLVDPVDVAEIDHTSTREHLQLRAVLITHEHHDHAGEAAALQKRYNIPVYASVESAPQIRGVVTPVHNKETLSLGVDFKITAHKTPGHTEGHLAYEIGGFLFTGDALFHGGCGHCRSTSSNLDEHYVTLNERLMALSPELIVMPGHYYAARNLDFALYIEPENKRAQEMRARLTHDGDELQHQTTLKQEKEYNPFLRLGLRDIRAQVAALVEKDLSDADDRAVFKEMRALRDTW